MNTVLLVSTVVAAAVAIAALLALFVAFRQERRRSDARVAALRQLASEDPAGEIALGATEPLPDAFVPDGRTHVTFDESHEASHAMFSDATGPSPWRRRLAAAVVMAVIVTAVGYGLLPRRSTPPSGTAAAGAAAQALPLELLSLRHTQQEGRLAITGLVQNPRGGVPVSKVIATAFLFSADGTFLASGRAPLDFSTLAAGDESPFVLTVPVTGTVARYRVGFRGEDGRVIAHVDRRATGTLARTEE